MLHLVVGAVAPEVKDIDNGRGNDLLFRYGQRQWPVIQVTAGLIQVKFACDIEFFLNALDKVAVCRNIPLLHLVRKCNHPCFEVDGQNRHDVFKPVRIGPDRCLGAFIIAPDG